MTRLLRLAVATLFVAASSAVAASAGETFPGDNGKILFTRFGGGKHREGLITMDPDGTKRKQIIGGRNVDDAEVSPDGAHIVYTKTNRAGQILMVNTDGSGTRKLTSGRRPKLDPQWSPDGSRVLFVSLRRLYEGNTVLHVVNADGSGQRRLTSSKTSIEDPTWSPDGSHIAYSCPTRKGSDICEIGVDGTGRRTLISLPGFEWGPDYSPDGDSILLLAERRHKKDRFYIYPKLYVAPVDGSKGRFLTRGKEIETEFAQWSPDGRHIGFVNCRGFRPCKVKVTEADGEGKRLLDTREVYDLVWSPNSRRLAYGQADVLTVNVSSGRVRRLAGGARRTQVTATSWQSLP